MRRLTAVLMIAALAATACGDGEVNLGLDGTTSTSSTTTTSTPDEPDPVEIMVAETQFPVMTDRTSRYVGGRPEPVDPASLGIADASATAFVTDGMVVIEMSEGLWDASGCVGIVDPLAEPVPAAVVAGPDCPDGDAAPQLSAAVETEPVLVSDDGAFVSFAYNAAGPLDAIGLIVAVAEPDGVVAVEGTTGGDGTVLEMTEFPAAQIGDRFVLSASGTVFDGIEVQAE